MSKYIKLYASKEEGHTLERAEKGMQKQWIIDVEKFLRFVRTLLFSLGFSTLLILAYTTEYFYFQKIAQASFIIGSVLMVKYLGESKLESKK